MKNSYSSFSSLFMSSIQIWNKIKYNNTKTVVSGNVSEMKNFIIFVNKEKQKGRKQKQKMKDKNTQRVIIIFHSREISCATLKKWEFQPYIKSLLYEHIRSKWNWKTKDGKKKLWQRLENSLCHHLFAWWPRFLFE